MSNVPWIGASGLRGIAAMQPTETPSGDAVSALDSELMNAFLAQKDVSDKVREVLDHYAGGTAYDVLWQALGDDDNVPGWLAVRNMFSHTGRKPFPSDYVKNLKKLMKARFGKIAWSAAQGGAIVPGGAPGQGGVISIGGDASFVSAPGPFEMVPAEVPGIVSEGDYFGPAQQVESSADDADDDDGGYDGDDDDSSASSAEDDDDDDRE